MHSPGVTLVIAFVLGVLANSGGDHPAPDRGFRLAPQFRLVTPALGICILIFAVPKLPSEIYAERARIILSGWQYMESPEIARSAEQFARRGIRYDPGNPELYYCLGEALIAQASQTTDPGEKMRLLSEAAEAHRAALSRAPRDSRLLLCLASALDSLERFDEARPIYAEAIQRDPISKFAHWAFGHHFEMQGKLDEAEAAYLHSLRLGGGAAAQMGLDRIAELRRAQSSATQQIPPASGHGPPTRE
jgi:tetratricopeptide (TPR) repeat protein